MGFHKLFLIFALSAVSSVAYSQGYPNKPVRLIISFTPGSSTDIIGRVVAAKLAEIWNQPVVAENRAGAGGTIGSKYVIDQPADGYTLLANSSAHAANPGIYAKMPYDTLKDFTNLALLGGGPNVMITSPDSGLKSLADFVKEAKANPGKLNFASAGIGSGTHFIIEKLLIATGVQVTHVPYKGRPALLGGGPNVMITSPDSGLKSLADFVREAKANPGKLNFASAGIGSGTHFNIEKLLIATGVQVTHVPYKGTPEAIGDTIGNRTCCYWAPLNAALPHVNGGKALALAVSSAQRSPLLPNVPTVAEQGYAGFDYTLWVGLWGQSGLPADIAAKINKDVNAALAAPDVRERLTKLGTVPGNMTIPEFSAFVRKEIEDTQKILSVAGIKPQ